MFTHRDVRDRFAQFWQSRGHTLLTPIPLVLQGDPTTLFTGSGMQQLVPNLLGTPHALGKRLYNIQRCIRAQDIDEVGDNRHDTFFEMMGNWSLGDYFKSEQLPWVFELFTERERGLGLNPAKLYVTVFGGADGIGKDDESIQIWQTLFAKVGIHTTVGTADTFNPDQHITLYDAQKNWWSRAGVPSAMPAGEVGGPDSEVFYDFGTDRRLHEESAFKDERCHVNCDCGRFLEIGNTVFIQYVKQADGSLKELPSKNVDFGGGLERVLAAIHDDPDIFKTDLFAPIVRTLLSSHEYHGLDEITKRNVRIIADHVRSAFQLLLDGVYPGPKERNYFMRRLLRRALDASRRAHIPAQRVSLAIDVVAEIYRFEMDNQQISEADVTIIQEEIAKYEKTLNTAADEFRKRIKKQPGDPIDGDEVFRIYQSTGLPPDTIVDIGSSVGAVVTLDGFERAKEQHSALSRAGSEQRFKGGLADHSEQVVRYHTATHLLHQALCNVLGKSVRQEGSNITGQRLRFDFSCDHKPTQEEIQMVSDEIQSKIHEALTVRAIVLPKAHAEKLGAKSFFKEKYPDTVKVYVIGASEERIQALGKDPFTIPDSPFAYSLEFCGGPHVENTKEIGSIEIYKTEKIGTDLYRIYAK